MTKKLKLMLSVAALALTGFSAAANARQVVEHTETVQQTNVQTAAQPTEYVHETGYVQRTAVDQRDGTLYSPLTGVYVGGYGGYNWDPIQVDGTGNPSTHGVEYGGFVGYSLNTLLDRWTGLGLTGAIEGHYGYSNARDHKSGLSFRKRDEWGVDFRPGLTIVDKYSPFGLKPYGIIGYQRAKFDESAGAAGGTSQHHNGLALGFGTEFLTYNHFGIRADYEHVFYQKNNGVDPSDNELRLGAALHF